MPSPTPTDDMAGFEDRTGDILSSHVSSNHVLPFTRRLPDDHMATLLPMREQGGDQAVSAQTAYPGLGPNAEPPDDLDPDFQQLRSTIEPGRMYSVGEERPDEVSGRYVAPESHASRNAFLRRRMRGAEWVPYDHWDESQSYFGDAGKPSWFDLIGATFRRENWIAANYVDPADDADVFDEEDPDFNSEEYYAQVMREMKLRQGTSDLGLTDRSVEILLSSENRNKFDLRLQRIMSILVDQKIQHEAGFWANMGANLLIAPLDPINYLPIGIAVKPGKAILSAAGTGAYKFGVGKGKHILASRATDVPVPGILESAAIKRMVRNKVGGALLAARMSGRPLSRFRGAFSRKSIAREYDELEMGHPIYDITRSGRLVKPKRPRTSASRSRASRVGRSAYRASAFTGKLTIASLKKIRLARAVGYSVPPIIISETALQHYDPQRTAAETGMNIGASILFTGFILGVKDLSKFVRASTNRSVSDHIKGLLNIPKMIPPSARVGGWRSGKELPESSQIIAIEEALANRWDQTNDEINNIEGLVHERKTDRDYDLSQMSQADRDKLNHSREVDDAYLASRGTGEAQGALSSPKGPLAEGATKIEDWLTDEELLSYGKLNEKLQKIQGEMDVFRENLPAGIEARIAYAEAAYKGLPVDRARKSARYLAARRAKRKAGERDKGGDEGQEPIDPGQQELFDEGTLKEKKRPDDEAYEFATGINENRYFDEKTGLWDYEGLEDAWRREIGQLKIQLRNAYRWRVVEHQHGDSTGVDISIDNNLPGTMESALFHMASKYMQGDSHHDLGRLTKPILKGYAFLGRIMNGLTGDDSLEGLHDPIRKVMDDLLAAARSGKLVSDEDAIKFDELQPDTPLFSPMVAERSARAHIATLLGRFAKLYSDVSTTAAGKYDIEVVAPHMEAGKLVHDTVDEVITRYKKKHGIEIDADPIENAIGMVVPYLNKAGARRHLVIIDSDKLYYSWQRKDWMSRMDLTRASASPFHFGPASDSSKLVPQPPADHVASGTTAFDVDAFGGTVNNGRLEFNLDPSAEDSALNGLLKYTSYVVEHELLHVDHMTSKGGSVSLMFTDRLGRSLADRRHYESQIPLENAINYTAYLRSVGLESAESKSPFAPRKKGGRGVHTDGIPLTREKIESDMNLEYLLLDEPSARGRDLAELYGINEHTDFDGHEIIKDGKGNKIVQWITKVTNPGFQIADSSSAVMRKVASALINTPWYYKDEVHGFTNGPSVQARASTYIGYTYQALKHHRAKFNNWRTRIAKERGLSLGGRFNFKLNEEFNRLVGSAMIGNRAGRGIGDPDAVAAANAWRKHVYDPMVERIIEVGLVERDVVEDLIKLNGSYFHRVYDKIKIKESQAEFIKDLAKHFEKASGRDKGLEQAKGVYAKIMSSPDGSHDPGDISVRGANRNRALDIPDIALERWLVTDVELVSFNYTKIWGTDLELKRSFGDPSMAGEIREIETDFDNLIKEWSARTDKGASKVVAKLKRDKVDHVQKLKGIRDKMRNMDDLPADPSSIIHRLPGVIRGFAYSAQSGSFLLSNIPDLANTVAFYGLNRTFGAGWVPYINNLKNMEMTKETASRLAIAVERLKGPILAEMVGTQSVYGRPMSRATDNSNFIHRMFDKAESTSYKAAQISNTVNLMAPFADVCQMVNYLVTQDFILDAAFALKKGKRLDTVDTMKLAKLGLNKDSLSKIWGEFNRHGVMEGKNQDIPVSNMDQWTDSNTSLTFQGALKTAQDLSNMAPGPGDRPFAITGPWGKLATMYMGFGFAAMSRIGVSRMQMKDQAALQGIVMQLGLGALVVYLKDAFTDKGLPQTQEAWVAEVVDRSGLLGWLANADILLGIASNGTVGLNAWTGHPNAEFSAEAMLETALGPGGSFIRSTAESIFGIPTDLLTSGKLSSGTVSSLRNTIPWTKLFYLQGLFNFIDAFFEGFDSMKDSMYDRFSLR